MAPPPKIPVRENSELENFAKTKGILFALVRPINSLILKVKDIAIFAANISDIFQKLDTSAKSVFVYVI